MGLEVALHSVNTDRDAVDERERLRVFCEHGSEDACDNVSEPKMPIPTFLESDFGG